MANGLNKALLVGNLGMDPDLKYTQGGQAVLRLRLATSETWVDKDNQRKERTEWHTVVVWGKRAEGLGRVLTKGKQLWVEGRIQTRSWEDKDGVKRYSTEINATDIGLLGSGNGGGGREGGDYGGRAGRSSGESSSGADQGYGGGGYGGGDASFDPDDDIPF